MKPFIEKLMDPFLVILFSFIWTSAFIAGAFSIPYLGPYFTLLVRFALSAVLLFLMALISKSYLFDLTTVKTGLIMGLFNNVIYLSCSFAALQYISPSWVTIIVSCSPFITAIFAPILRLEKFSVKKICAVFIGFFGVYIIIGRNLTNANYIGIMLAAIGAVSFVAGTLYFKYKGTEQSGLALNFWQSIIGTVMLIPLSVLLYPKNGIAFSILSGFAVLYLVVVVTIAGMLLWFYLIKKNGAATASIYHLINPFFGVLLAHIFFGAKITPMDCIGLVIIAGAIILGRKPAALRA
ncbi:MAG: DMT family transporter [Spirochaetaceae bacterium]|jgi:drug/metabolite transporter (DMT)-like permease|nr:DMT family transporter [Spirochaetaceae bacterium]